LTAFYHEDENGSRYMIAREAFERVWNPAGGDGRDTLRRN
jgi:hypothetical protein